YSAVLDATYLDPAERTAAADVARTAGVPFTGLWLTAPADVLRARVAARTGDASDATVAVLERQLTVDPGALDWAAIDASGDAQASLDAARAVLVTRGQ